MTKSRRAVTVVPGKYGISTVPPANRRASATKTDVRNKETRWNWPTVRERRELGGP